MLVNEAGVFACKCETSCNFMCWNLFHNIMSKFLSSTHTTHTPRTPDVCISLFCDSNQVTANFYDSVRFKTDWSHIGFQTQLSSFIKTYSNVVRVKN